jgi:hypothetical protein
MGFLDNLTAMDFMVFIILCMVAEMAATLRNIALDVKALQTMEYRRAERENLFSNFEAGIASDSSRLVTYIGPIKKPSKDGFFVWGHPCPRVH